MSQTLEEQAAGLITSTFKDGEASDGSPTDEETAAALADAPKAEEAAAVEGDETDETDEQEAEASAEPPKADAKPAKGGKPGVQERIGDITAKFRGAERQANAEKARADALQAELDALKGGKAPLTTPQPAATGGATPPDASQYDYGELDPKFISALARYEAKQELAAEAARNEETRQAAAADAERQERATKQTALTKAGAELYDDFDEVVMQGAQEGRWQLSPHLGPLLLDSDFGAQIAYALASDPAEADRVFGLSPAGQAKWLGRQEATFEAAKSSQARPAPKAPQAPPPPKTPRGGSGSNKVSADSSDFAAVERAWRSGQL